MARRHVVKCAQWTGWKPVIKSRDGPTQRFERSTVLQRQASQTSTITADGFHAAARLARAQENLKWPAAAIEADRSEKISEEAVRAGMSLTYGSMIYLLISTEDPALPTAVRELAGRGIKVVGL